MVRHGAQAPLNLGGIQVVDPLLALTKDLLVLTFGRV